MVQLAPAANMPVHVLLPSKNWPASVPPSEAATVPEAALPVLVTVNVTGALVLPLATGPKFCGVGVMVNVAALGQSPFKLALTLPPGVAETLSEAVLVPAMVGENVTTMVQVAAGANVPLHVLVPIVNWLASVPASEVVMAPEAAPPVLVTVNVTGALVLALATDPKLCVVGEMLKAAAAGVLADDPPPPHPASSKAKKAIRLILNLVASLVGLRICMLPPYLLICETPPTGAVWVLLKAKD